MPVRIEKGAEPIPGYKLIERLGGGGFGEVWKAEAPGGLMKAIKFVFGDLHAHDDEDGARAKQELKALNRVKTVHHPYILSLECVHIIDGQLMIVMELADRTLYDRFRECVKQGLPGIPRQELLGYMQETAEALDLMNDQYKLQHLDIKPQNLFLVFNHVKVADFGLVKDLEGMQATVTGGVTPVYAAPETFDGWVSCSSDQYSLAIVYQELLTGQRPFTGGTIRQLVMQHMQGAPDLSSLRRAERPIVARALSKNHEHRFSTCQEFIQKLCQCHADPAPPISPPQPMPADSAPTSKPATGANLEASPQPQLDLDVTRNARGRLVKPSAVQEIARAESVPLPMAPVPPRPPRPPKAAANASRPIGQRPTSESLPLSVSLPSIPFTESGILRPALVVGLGQAGVDILRNLRKQLNEQFGAPEATPHVRLLAIDTDPEAVQEAMRGESPLQPSEVVLTRLHRPSHYLKSRDGKVPFESWLPSKVLYAIPRQQNHAGVRILGRLALVDNHRAIAQKLGAELAACADPETLQLAAQATGLEPRTRCPRVFIIASLAGGTGGGMLLDLAYLSRRLLRQQGFKDAEVIGALFLPPAQAGDGVSKAMVNTCAALSELNFFAAPDALFTARYDQRDGTTEKPVQEKGPAFQRCVFFPLAQRHGLSGAARTAAATQIIQAAQYLHADLIAPVGQAADNARRDLAATHVGAERGSANYQTAGICRFESPRRDIRKQAAQRLGSRLVAHWMNKDASGLKSVTEPWVQEQWDNLGFRPENLIERFHQRSAELLGQAAEPMWTAIINPLAELLKGPAGADPVLRWTPVVQAVENLEKLLGIPPEFQGLVSQSADVAAVERALREAGANIAREYEQLLAELIVRLFEEPNFRMAGAEEAIRQFSACVQKALESQEPLLRELQGQAAALYKRIHMLLESPTQANQSTPHSRWRGPFTRRNQDQLQAAPTLVELLRSYAKSRYQSAVLLGLNSLYVCLRGLLSDQMREISFCRQRLIELADLVREPAASEGPNKSAAQRLLLPPGCDNIQDAVRQVDGALAQPDLLAFDALIQEELIRKQYRALVNVCMASSTVIRDLAGALQQHAEAFLEDRLEGTDAAALLLSQHADDVQGRSKLGGELLEAFEKAAPSVGPECEQTEVFFISSPRSEAGEQFRQLARQLFPTAVLVASNRQDEILFLRHRHTLALSDFDQFGSEAQEAYRQRLAQDSAFIHSRADIADWQPETVA